MSIEHSPARAHNGGAARNLDEYSTPEGLAKKHSELFSLQQLRWALRFRDDNGLSQHVTKFGRRLYIHEPGFVTWFHRQGQEG